MRRRRGAGGSPKAAVRGATEGVRHVDKPNLTLVQMAVLEAVARCGGIGAAARDLGLSQPSVSNHVNQIEARLALRLFRRKGHHFAPDQRLHAILPRIRAILKLSSDLEAALRAETALETGRLTIGYSTHQFVMPVLADYGGRHPGIRLEARSMGSFDLIAALRSGDIEAAFATLPAPEPDLVGRLLREEGIVLMVGSGDPLAARGAIGWPDLAGLPLIRREPMSGTRAAFDLAALRQGVAVTARLDLGSWDSLREAARLGMGPALVMRGEIDAQDTRVAAVRIGPPFPTVGHHLVTLPEFRGSAPVEALFEVVERLLPPPVES